MSIKRIFLLLATLFLSVTALAADKLAVAEPVGKGGVKAHVVGVGGAKGDFLQNISVCIGKGERGLGAAAVDAEIVFDFAHKPSCARTAPILAQFLADCKTKQGLAR